MTFAHTVWAGQISRRSVIPYLLNYCPLVLFAVIPLPRPRDGIFGGGYLFCCHGLTSGLWRGASEATCRPSKATLISVRLLD